MLIDPTAIFLYCSREDFQLRCSLRASASLGPNVARLKADLARAPHRLFPRSIACSPSRTPTARSTSPSTLTLPLTLVTGPGEASSPSPPTPSNRLIIANCN